MSDTFLIAINALAAGVLIGGGAPESHSARICWGLIIVGKISLAALIAGGVI